jgi:hypothetical protein
MNALIECLIHHCCKCTDVDAVTQTTRRRDNQPGKRHRRPWCNEVAVALAVDVDRVRARAGVAVARAVGRAVVRAVVAVARAVARAMARAVW